MSKKVRRLYEQFVPERYKLEIDADPSQLVFSGTVVIEGRKTGRPAKRLTFHQKELRIDEAVVTRHDKHGDQEVAIKRINRHAKFDEVRLHSDQMMFPGRYSIRLRFSGRITRQMNGMYPCLFKHDGQDKQLIATQFESHHAREVFPCIDEPEAKAVFELTLKTPADMTVLSNTPIKTAKTNGGRQTTVFEATPLMSSYLLAFAFGEMGYLEAKSKSGVTVRTYATPDNVELTEFALHTAVKCLDFYEDYFGIPYPLVKLDFVALPDFASGAMENWGLITFREQTMLVDPDNTSLPTKQYVAMVIAHELAHQWFGNLVTMRWWTDLWLNEGFASWIEYLAVDHIFPEWQVWVQFIADEQQRALKLDALKNTHPIEVPVNHPDEIRTIFDTISYSKGASVIHMLHAYLGDKDFQTGLRHYLKKHSHGNTDTVDLWQALEDSSNKPVKDFMSAWTSLPGFPLVSVKTRGDKLTLSQTRFYLDSGVGASEETWPVPLLSFGGRLPDQLAKPDQTYPASNNGPLKINTGQGGFYRVAYEPEHLQRLGASAGAKKLEPLDRLGLVSDLFESAKAGHVATVDALKFLTNFANEDNYAVWDVIAASLGSLRLVMGDDGLREAMKPFVRQLTAKELTRLGWEKRAADDHFDRLLRPVILGMAAGADEASVVANCQRLFKAVRTPETETAVPGIGIDPDVRGVVFSTAARTGGKAEFDKLLKLHNATRLSEDRITLAAALTNFSQAGLISRALELIKSEHVRLQDVAYWIAYAFSNHRGRDAAWDWLKANWDWLEQNIGSDMSFSRLPLYAARAFSSKDFMVDFKAFFEPKLGPALERSYQQGLETLRWQSAWKRRDFKAVVEFFKTHQ